MDTATLSEDPASEPQNKNPDEIRGRIVLTPRVAEQFESAESNLRTISLALARRASPPPVQHPPFRGAS